MKGRSVACKSSHMVGEVGVCKRWCRCALTGQICSCNFGLPSLVTFINMKRLFLYLLKNKYLFPCMSNWQTGYIQHLDNLVNSNFIKVVYTSKDDSNYLARFTITNSGFGLSEWKDVKHLVHNRLLCTWH